MVCQTFRHLIYKRQRKMIFTGCFIQFSVIYAHSPNRNCSSGYRLTFIIFYNSHAILFGHYLYGANPPTIRDRIDYACVKYFLNLFSHNIFHIRIQSPLKFYRCGMIIIKKYSMHAKRWTYTSDIIY